MKDLGQTKGVALKVWTLLLVVFALGAIVGASIDAVFRSREAPGQSMPSMRDSRAYFEVLRRELALGDHQTSEINAILDESREEYRAVCAEVRPRYDALREKVRGRIRSVLSPEQQERFNSMVLQEDCAKCPASR
jgi:hypothetical protein